MREDLKKRVNILSYRELKRKSKHIKVSQTLTQLSIILILKILLKRALPSL